MINKQRLLDEFIELVSVPCPSKDEKAEADLIIKKLAEIGINHRQRMGIHPRQRGL